MNYTVIIVLILILLIILVTSLYIIGVALDRFSKFKENEFELKMAMAEAQSKSMSVKSFEELRLTLDYIISFYVAHDVSMSTNNIKDTEKSDLLKLHTVNISANVRNALSSEFKRQMSCYVDLSEDTEVENFLDYYIRKTAMLMTTKVIERADS